jgi:hypothetical protein
VRQVLDVLVHAVVADVLVAGSVLSSRLSRADDGIGIEIFDDGLQSALDLPAEDQGDLFRLTDGPIQVQQPLTEFVQEGAAEEDPMVAVLGLGEEQPVSTDGLTPLAIGEERMWPAT